METKRGVYFLANDAVLDLSIAFLNSFRKFNPDIPLCLLPYNEDCEKTYGFSRKYNFFIYPNNEVLIACDNISKNYFSYVSGNFRKLAMWEGPFEEFIYIDTDTVVLENVEFSYRFLSEYDFITSHSNIPSIRKFVWKDSIYSVNVLSQDQINYATNCGFITSHKKALSLSLVQQNLNTTLKIKDHMELGCVEQPFLNYLFVTSGKYTSLLVLFFTSPFREEVAFEQWGGRKDGVVKNGRIYFPNEKAPTFLIHWAGIYRPNNFERWFFKKFLPSLGIKKEMPCISYFLPYRRLWKYYRYLNEN